MESIEAAQTLGLPTVRSLSRRNDALKSDILAGARTLQIETRFGIGVGTLGVLRAIGKVVRADMAVTSICLACDAHEV